MNDIIELDKNYGGHIEVSPRWPYSRVLISPVALRKLELAQEILGSNFQLVLTRGYECQSFFLRHSHRIARWIGAIIFLILYPTRAAERWEIFCPNGHNEDGTHIDISVKVLGQKKHLLPMGVFTSSRQLKSIFKTESHWLTVVYDALKKSGFKVHANLTESFQIHCDLTGD